MSLGRHIARVLLALTAVAPLHAATLDDEMRVVERIRDLRFTAVVPTVTIDRSELPGRLREQFVKTLPYSTEDWSDVLRALHLVGESRDLVTPLLELYESQVLAYYDPLDRTYYAIRQLPEAAKKLPAGAPLEQSIAIHELTHALQNQHFAIGAGDYAIRADTDASLAYHAVLEGEATLVMLAYLVQQGGASLDEVVKNDLLVEALAAAAASDAGVDPSTPRYFKELLKFPYVQGLRFVLDAYRRGGWAEMNRVHANLPRTTRQILHPQEYFSGSFKPQPFRDAFAGLKPLTVEHLGEFHWGVLVGAGNARGWVNDRVAIVQNEYCEATVLAETLWESPIAAQRFRDAYSRFLDDEEVSARISIDGAMVRVAYGADAKAMKRFIP